MQYAFENLVFRGGGVRGIAYAGAIDILARPEYNIMPGVKRVSGASAGAIVSLLVALKYDPAHIHQILKTTSFKSFMDDFNPARVLTKYGLYSGDFALEWLGKLVAGADTLDKTLDANATFKDLKEAGGLDLYMYTTDIQTHSSQELSYRATPDVKLAEAARSSMSIPLFFNAFRFSQGLPEDRLYVDGGMVYNFPMTVFDEAQFLPSGTDINPRTLGFYFVPPPNQEKEVHDFGTWQFAKYFANTFETILLAQNIDFAKDANELKRTVMISTCGIKATDFNLTEAQQEMLVDAGTLSTEAYLKAYPASNPGAISPPVVAEAPDDDEEEQNLFQRFFDRNKD